MKKRLLSVLLVATLVLTCFFSAAPVNASKEDAQRKKQEAEAKLKQLEDEKA